MEPLCSSSSDQSYLCGNKSFEERLPVFSNEVEIQNKYELLNDDNDKRESRGVKSVGTPPSLTRLKKISSRRVRSDEWSKLYRLPVPFVRRTEKSLAAASSKTDKLDRLPAPFVHRTEKLLETSRLTPRVYHLSPGGVQSLYRRQVREGVLVSHPGQRSSRIKVNSVLRLLHRRLLLQRARCHCTRWDCPPVECPAPSFQKRMLSRISVCHPICI